MKTSPDGEWIAASGWTRGVADELQVYIFNAVSGMLRQRIAGLPEVINHLAFSPAGDRLVAALGSGGIRLYARDGADGWTEAAADTNYDDRSYGVAFAPDGRFATTCYDGWLRLYAGNGSLLHSVPTPYEQPFSLAFNPVDGRLAVGFHDAPEALLFDVATLASLATPDVHGIDNGNLMAVAWSADGATSDVAPGARLHVLAIGVSDYGDAARHLELAYADQDARDVVEALRRSQSSLYAEVLATALVNEAATKTRIFAGPEAIRKDMEAGGGADLAVIQFSGHGDMVDGGFYLLPHGIEDGSRAAVKANGLPAVQFHDEIAAIARHGRVILLVDACRSGGATALPGCARC